MYVIFVTEQEKTMDTEGLKVLKARLWDQRIKVRNCIKDNTSPLHVDLNELDELFLIENEMLEEFEKLRTAIAKDISTVESWLKQLEELKFETR